jgi:hypothetical protein
MAAHHHDTEHHHDPEGALPAAYGTNHAEHTMTASMLRIQRQHIWMTLVGIALALFKLLADSRWGGRLMQFAWPSAMACLGVLLVLYRE